MCIQQMGERCPGAVVVSRGFLPDYRFRINGRGVATVVPEPGASVHGILWNLTERHVETLHEYEGVRPGRYTPHYFHVDEENSGVPRIAPGAGPRYAVETCLVYIATDSRVGPPREGYLERVMRAADFHEFSQEYRREIAGWAQAVSE
jgi:hypothetical protein